jgi:hypothetical protein
MPADAYLAMTRPSPKIGEKPAAEHVSEPTGADCIPPRRLSYFGPIGRQPATNVKDFFLHQDLAADQPKS